MKSLNRRSMMGGAAAFGALGAAEAHAFFLSAPPMGTWTERRDMPFPVQEIYPTAFWRTDPSGLAPRPGSLLVNAGGIVPQTQHAHRVTDRTTFYDRNTEWWGEGPRLPEPRHHLALCNHNGKLYGVGGFFSDAGGMWRMRPNVWRLDDLNAPLWYGMTSLPIPNAEGVVFSLGGLMHVIGGRAPAGTSNREWRDHLDTDRHWVYDDAKDKWESRAPLPRPRNSMAAAVIGDSVYVIGGRTVDGGNTPSNEVYVPWTDRWQKAAPMPSSRRTPGAPQGQSGLAAAVWRKKIYVFGGEWWIDEETGGVYSDVWEYNPPKDEWRSLAPMPRPRHGLGAVALEDGIYVAGGASGWGMSGITAALDRFVI
jgi:hypothetical protein